MKFFDNPDYILPYFASNAVALLLLWVSYKNTKIGRILFALLFIWASITNYRTAHLNPQVYLEYAEMSVNWYRNFILGWFSNHITVMVTVIAVGQALIGVSMLLNKTRVKLACAGAVLFLMSIAPLGVGAAFPFSLIVSVAALIIFRRDNLHYIWKLNNKKQHA